MNPPGFALTWNERTRTVSAAELWGRQLMVVVGQVLQLPQ